MAGITEYGFTRKTLQQIIASLNTRFASKLGNDWNTSANSVENQFLTVFAEEADQVWQGMEGVYSSQTYTGAEGVYLDDIISQEGVFRKGKTKGSGEVVVFADLATTTPLYDITSGRSVSASNGITYTTSTSKLVNNLMSCYQLKATSLTNGQPYTFSMYNVESTNTNTFTWVAGDSANIDEMLIALGQFANSNISGLEYPAYYDLDSRTLFIGFNPNINNIPSPLPKANLYLSVSPLVGQAGYTLAVEANTEGYYPLNIDEAGSLSPSFTGYKSLINWEAFSTGSDVQTDAQYRASYENIDSTSRAGTAAVIKAEVLEVSGTVDAEVYENPTSEFIYDIYNTLVCNPYTYNTVVLGGAELDVAKAIGSVAPVSVGQYGTTEVSYTDDDSNTIDVKFTKATYFDFAVEVTYTTKDGTYFSDVEKAEIAELMIQLTSELDIGGVVPLEQIQASVYRATTVQRLKSTTVQLKDITNIGGQFISEDLTTRFNEKPLLVSSNITFTRV